MQDWARNLRGTQPLGSEHEWLGPDATQVRDRLGEGAIAWATEVGEAVAAKMSAEVPEIVQAAAQFNVLRRATTSTTLRALALVTDPRNLDSSLVSPEALETAQDFAQRGLELNDILRSIRVGFTVLAAALLDAIIEHGNSTEELRRVSILMLEMVDEFTSVITTAFMDERRAQEADASAIRLDLTRALIDAKPVDEGAATRLLGYPLNAVHLALIAFSDPLAGGDRVDLRKVVDPVFTHWGRPQATLIIPVGGHTLWAWAAYGPSAPRRDAHPLPTQEGINVAVGEVWSGIDGFRRTHLDAKAVEQLQSMSGRGGASTVAHHDVDLESLLLMDPDAAQRFATHYLGPLAGAEPRIAELRATLRTYLECDHRLGAVAEQRHISRSTVTYRVQQALAMCAHPPSASTTKLRAALAIQEWLAGAAPG
ncbi:PucR family transcriptional regulator [Mycolicibacterium palauense]|uniref:PucR family transcriptional regulator n=1 Tax=Mycolicibacterium palauense TaxID=2034511 RepID=UPI000BFEB2A0|nr:helix-turn-helix domain-containing protein [Mycolicibacterium palauense]